MAVPTGKVHIMCLPGATIATNATSTGYADTLDFDFAEVCIFGPTHATNNQPATLTLSAGTTTVVSSQTDIVAFTGGTAVDATHGFVIPASVTTATSGYCVKMLVNLQERERYLGISYTPGTAATHYMTAICNLYRGDHTPRNTTTAQVQGLITEAGAL